MQQKDSGKQGQYWKDHLMRWEASAYYKERRGNVPFAERVATLLRGNGMYVRMEAAVRMAAPHIKGLNVLDLGCGSGRFALRLAEAGARTVTGIDISPDAIGAAERRRLESPHAEQLSFREADLTDAALELPQVDLVTALGVLEYFDATEVEALLAKLKTRYFLFDFPDVEGRTRTWLIWSLRQVYLRINRCPGVFLYSQDEFRQMAGRHGFADVRYARRSIFDFATNLPPE